MKLAIIGAGGHAKEVYQSVIRQDALHQLSGFYIDSQYLKEESSLYGLSIKSTDELDFNEHIIHIAVGDINFREKIYKDLKELGFSFATIIDPSSIIGDNDIEEGSYIAPGAIITASSKIGKCCIVNTGAIVSHDCKIEDFCNISPGAVLCGDVRIGEKSLIGAGSLIREKTWIRDNVILGMGSVVTKNILDRGTYIIHDSITKKL